MRLVIGVDPHKQTHTAVAVRSGSGELAGELTAAALPAGHRELLAWARLLGEKRVWALEDVRGVSRGLEPSLVARGERVVRVRPKLMAGARRGGRSYGKSDSIYALAIARAALAHPDLPAAVEDQAARDQAARRSPRNAGAPAHRVPGPAALAAACDRPRAACARRCAGSQGFASTVSRVGSPGPRRGSRFGSHVIWSAAVAADGRGERARARDRGARRWLRAAAARAQGLRRADRRLADWRDRRGRPLPPRGAARAARRGRAGRRVFRAAAPPSPQPPR
jgi:Transposase